MSLSKVLQLADKFAQQTTASRPEDIHSALSRARLLGTTTMVSPLLERAQVPAHTTANIKVTVAPGPTATFNTTLNPAHSQAAQKLDYYLNARFGKLVSEALQNAKVNVQDPVSVDWLQITRLGQ